ncbi:hypothetical protein LTR95_002935 [Oleoguttula sp. CCFEE 5521]
MILPLGPLDAPIGVNYGEGATRAWKRLLAELEDIGAIEAGGATVIAAELDAAETVDSINHDSSDDNSVSTSEDEQTPQGTHHKLAAKLARPHIGSAHVTNVNYSTSHMSIKPSEPADDTLISKANDSDPAGAQRDLETADQLNTMVRNMTSADEQTHTSSEASDLGCLPRGRRPNEEEVDGGGHVHTGRGSKYRCHFPKIQALASTDSLCFSVHESWSCKRRTLTTDAMACVWQERRVGDSVTDSCHDATLATIRGD